MTKWDFKINSCTHDLGETYNDNDSDIIRKGVEQV